MKLPSSGTSSRAATLAGAGVGASSLQIKVTHHRPDMDAGFGRRSGGIGACRVNLIVTSQISF